MASFNIFSATKEGFQFVANNQKLIFRLGSIPILVKFICLVTSYHLGLEENALRKGLILFPAYLLEGYLICTLLRIAIFRHEAIIQPPGAESYEHYKRRAADIQAGAIVYTLLKMIVAFIVGMLVVMAAPMQPEQSGEGGFTSFLVAVFFIGAMIWAFRLLWLYVPVTFGYSMRQYMHKIQGFSFSFHLFSVWIMALLPFALFFLVLSDVLKVFVVHNPDDPSGALIILLLALQSVLEMMLMIVASVAIGRGVMDVFNDTNNKSGY